MLALVAGVARAKLGERERIELFRSVGRRFLALSLAAAAVLALTGADMASDRLAGWAALADTETGRIILAKTILFATALGLALVHSFVLGPRTRRLRERLLESPQDEEVQAALRRSSAASGAVQGLILVETIAILILAADLIA